MACREWNCESCKRIVGFSNGGCPVSRCPHCGHDEFFDVYDEYIDAGCFGEDEDD